MTKKYCLICDSYMPHKKVDTGHKGEKVWECTGCFCWSEAEPRKKVA